MSNLSKDKKKMMEKYFFNLNEYKKKYGDKVILLWQCGTFYEVYANINNENQMKHLINYSKILNCKIAKKGNKYKMAGYGVSEDIQRQIPKLNENGYTVGVWKENGERPDNSKIRTFVGLYSPGTNFDNPDNNLSNNCCCIWIEHIEKFANFSPKLKCGISCVDIITGKSILYQYEYSNNIIHDSTAYDELERFISIYNPYETIIIHNISSNQVQELINFSNIDSNKIIDINFEDKNTEWYAQITNCITLSYHEKQLKHYYNIKDYPFFIDSNQLYENMFALWSFIFLLNFMEEHCKSLVDKIQEPVLESNHNTIKCANHSLKQINIIGNLKKKFSSIVNFTNKCTTFMGRRKFNDILVHPTTDVKYLNQQYELMKYFTVKCSDSNANEKLRKQLYDSNLCDFDKFYRKIINNSITPDDIFHFYHNLKSIMSIVNDIDQNYQWFSNTHYQSIKMNTSLLVYISNIINFIDTELDLDNCENITSLQDENFFKRGIHSKIDIAEDKYIKSRKDLIDVKKKFENLLRKHGRNCQNVKNPIVKIHYTKDKNIYLQLSWSKSIELKRLLKESNAYSFSGKKNGTQTIEEPGLKKICRNVTTFSDELKDQIIWHFNEFIKNFKDFYNDINNISNYISSLDLILTKVYISKKYNYCCPIIDEEQNNSCFDAKGLRHPIIENIQTSEDYVPNDISLGYNNKCGILLYGTNAVGKSSLIKSIGIAVLLAQSGMFVPATSFVYNPYKSIFTRILSNDDLFKHLSSFAVEISEFRTILNYANKDSLVLGDELCSGTEVGSAKTIFTGGLNWLSGRNICHIFATHYHEIATYKKEPFYKNISIKHMEVEYIPSSDKLIYHRKLKDGPGNNRYGLEVCKSLNLPEEFMKDCHRIRKIITKKKSTLEQKKSRYNSGMIKSNECEFCKNTIAEEIHHLTPQQFKNDHGYFEGIRINNISNLSNICTTCHNLFTEKGIIHRRTKTSNGIELLETN
jgi:DNA mismatch repair protein MutS